jgi:glycosyltransferase involved in cell wall biosynthesis
MLANPLRVTFAMTHPVQYYSPWFRYIAANRKDIELTVIYATVPTPKQQGVGFDTSFEWDISPLDGYHSEVLRPARESDYLHSDKPFGIHAPEIGTAIRRSRPDAVVVPGWYSVTLIEALTTCKLFGLPCIYRGDTPMPRTAAGVRNTLWAAKTRLMLALYSAYLTVGIRNRQYLNHFGVRDSAIHFAPNCVDNDRFQDSAQLSQAPPGRNSVREKLGIPHDSFAVLFVGKLDENKRPWDVIAAVAQLGENATAVIVGSGPSAERCRAEAERTGAHTVFAGFVNQSGLGEIYGACDATVLPSKSETWGLVVNESLAAGTPCVVSQGVGCAPDLIIQEKTGDVFTTGDIRALAAALSRIREAKSKGHDFKEECQRVVSGYSLEVATEGLVAAVRSVARPTRNA